MKCNTVKQSRNKGKRKIHSYYNVPQLGKEEKTPDGNSYKRDVGI